MNTRSSRPAVIVLALLTTLLGLAACGGGGGNGSSSGPTISVSQTSVNATTSVLAGAIVSVPISLVLPDRSAGTYYVAARWTTQGISDVALNLNAPATATINFKPGTSLIPGSYSDQVGLEICPDSDCASPFPNGTVTITTTYTVTAVDTANQPSITFAQTSVSVQALAIDPFPQPNVTVPFTLANFAQTPYLSTAISGSAVTVANIATSSPTQGSVTLAFPFPTTLGAGNHTATVSVTACLDSTCANPVPGSPFQITVNFDVGNSITVAGQYGYTVQAMQQQVDAMAWDPVHQLLYVVLPFDSTGSSHVATIDPVTQTMSAPVALDSSDSGILALSDDSQFLYVGLTNGTVQRLVLPQLTTDIRITLGTSLYPADVRVAPGAPHTVAIALSADPFNPVSEERGVVVFDDSVPRPNEVTATGIPATGTAVDLLLWTSGTSLFGDGYGASYNTSANLFSMPVDASGISASTNLGIVSGGRMYYAQNFIYMDGGTIFDTTTNQANNTLAATPNLYGLLPNSSSGRLFVSNSSVLEGTIQLQALDLQQLTVLAQITLPPLASQQKEWALWGQNGIVIRCANDLIFVQGGFVGP